MWSEDVYHAILISVDCCDKEHRFMNVNHVDVRRVTRINIDWQIQYAHSYFDEGSQRDFSMFPYSACPRTVFGSMFGSIGWSVQSPSTIYWEIRRCKTVDLIHIRVSIHGSGRWKTRCTVFSGHVSGARAYKKYTRWMSPLMTSQRERQEERP